MSSGHYRRSARSRLGRRGRGLVVRVDRRITGRDGIGGATERWVTLIDRYHTLGIMPSHNQKEERTELGEEEAPKLHFETWGDPSVNGHALREGDRFVDRVNNRWYIIDGIFRPPGSRFNTLYRYDLVELRVPKTES